MNIDHIIFFPNTLSRYDVLNHFTNSLMLAFERVGVSTELVVPDKNNLMPFLKKIYADQPDFTLSFNGLLPNDAGEFLADLIGIPHLCCLVDSTHFFHELIQSPYNVITCPDAVSCSLYKEMGFDQTFFLPHAVDQEILTLPQENPLYEIVFFGSPIDYQVILEKWQAIYDEKTVSILLDCAEAVLKQPELAYQVALSSALPSTKFAEQEYFQLLNDLDLYIRGKDRIELLQAIKKIPIHVFGEGHEIWRKYISNTHLQLHKSVDFQHVTGVMRRSKFVLNSSPMFKQGGHERIFTGIACNALVVTNETPYITQQFSQQELVTYTSKNRLELDDVLSFYLQHENERHTMAQLAKQKVALSHTWDHRVKEIQAKIPHFLEKIAEL